MAKPNHASREKSSIARRLKPVRQDPLENMGFVSKGDVRLLDLKVQDDFYQSIVTRYMQFCARHNPNLDKAFLALAEHSSAPKAIHQHKDDLTNSRIGSKVAASSDVSNADTNTAALKDAQKSELSIILMALRKLREGILGSFSQSASPVFAQRVHVFNIRVAILAMDAASYHPSLTYLLDVLHTSEHPLPGSELAEMTTYAILDRALRQIDLIAAYDLKYRSKEKYNYNNRTVEALLHAVITDNWVQFWRIRRRVDGYIRALMHCHIAPIRRTTLKAFGRAYLKTDLDWVLQSATGRDLTWEELVETEQVGWQLDGDTIIIRKPRVK